VIDQAVRWWGRHPLLTASGLGLLTAGATYIWMRLVLGTSCGGSPRFPQYGPSFDQTTAGIVLVCVATAVNTVLTALTKRPAWVLGVALITAAAAFGGFALGGLSFLGGLFLGGRNCFA
jgi:hypothetical protein